MTAPRSDHDALYHRLFSHPGVVAQLLREFADGRWLADLDLDGMERLNTKFHADSGQRREGDMVWRIPRSDGGDSYLMLLLEFQSSSDQHMALRLLAYTALLWQQLVREGRLLPNGKLPPLLPVVVYNGDDRWHAAEQLSQLVGLATDSPLWPLQPNCAYHVIDIGKFSAADLAGRDGLPALWFRLENSPNPAEIVAVADALIAWLAAHPGFAAARAVFAGLLGAMMAPLGPDVPVPEDLLEVRNMLATRAEQWKQGWRLEGLQEGRQVGLQEGREVGLQEGRQVGLEEGRQVGLQEGVQQGLQKGLQEGVQKGEAALLLRQLERRFGDLPDWAADRVRTADIRLLEDWGLRVLDAGSLVEVLGDRPA
jgi:hypothetical protein